MSEGAVVRAIGPPDAVRFERNGVVCFTYDLHEHRLWSHVFGRRTQIIALKENGLVDRDIIRTESVRYSDAALCAGASPAWPAPAFLE
jgi:hypothetical protein